MVDSRAKGATAETKIRDKLRELTKLQWERVPGSGALHEKHGLKGDLYIPGKENVFCIEVKHYAEDHITSEVLTGKEPQLLQWWKQCLRQSQQVDKKPLLIFKFDRSKLFVAFKDVPNYLYPMLIVIRDGHEFFVAQLDHWVYNEKPKFIK
jgi:hypothetical protein